MNKFAIILLIYLMYNCCAYADSQASDGAAKKTPDSNAVASQGVQRQERVGDIIKVGDKGYMLVRDFSTPEQNNTFQRDITIMRRYESAIKNINEKLPQISDEAKKKELQDKLKQFEDEFNVNNATMQRLYAFSAQRQYRLVCIDSNICLNLTKDEFSNLRTSEGEELDPLKIVDNNGVYLYRFKSVNGVRANEEFQRMLGFALTKKAESSALREKLSQITEPQEQLKISTELVALEKAVNENDAAIRTKYGIAGKRGYAVEISHAKLYLVLTPEEIAKIEAERALKK